MSMFNTYGGAFGPGGQGGGIFQTSVQGLGSLGLRARAVKGLGAVEVPWQCWDMPAFKACQDKAAGAAFSACQGTFTVGSASFNECTAKETDAAVRKCIDINCSQFRTAAAPAAPVATPTPTVLAPTLQCEDLPDGTFPWGAQSNWTLLLQNCINTKLGPGRVKVDGVLGSGTCAAAKEAGTFIPPTCSGSGGVSKTNTSSGGASPSPADTIPGSVQRLPSSKSNVGIWLAAVAVVGAGAYFLTRKKKGSR